MRTIYHSHPASLLALGLTCLLSGCASSPDPADPGLTPDRAKYLYPRQHYESLDPAQRTELERRMLEEQNKNKSNR